MIDFVDMIFFHAEAQPEKPAVITGEVTLTYAMLRKGILSVERQLRKHNLKSGDRVGVSVLNAIGHMTLICALHRAGITSVSLDRPQIEFLDDLVVEALLTDAPVAGKTIRMISVDESWFGGDFREVIELNLAQEADGDRPCRLILSSGTTGRPKIIALSFTAVQERLISYSVRMSTPSWDRLVCMLGLTTNYAYCFAITTLWLGRTICFAFDGNARQLILAHQAELLVASTHQITELVKGQEENFLRTRIPSLDPHWRQRRVCTAQRANSHADLQYALLRLRIDGRRHRGLCARRIDLRHGPGGWHRGALDRGRGFR